jgi:hypothetical protein
MRCNRSKQFSALIDLCQHHTCWYGKRLNVVPKYLCIEQGEVLRLQLEEMGQEVRELHQKYQTMLTVSHLDLYMQ